MNRRKQKTNARRRRFDMTIQQQAGTKTNSVGDQEQVWQDFARVRGSIKPLNSREYFYAQQAASDTTHLVNCRPPAEGRVVPAMRIVWPDRRYGTQRILEITGVTDLEEQGRELEIRCQEAT